MEKISSVRPRGSTCAQSIPFALKILLFVLHRTVFETESQPWICNLCHFFRICTGFQSGSPSPIMNALGQMATCSQVILNEMFVNPIFLARFSIVTNVMAPRASDSIGLPSLQVEQQLMNARAEFNDPAFVDQFKPLSTCRISSRYKHSAHMHANARHMHEFIEHDTSHVRFCGYAGTASSTRHCGCNLLYGDHAGSEVAHPIHGASSFVSLHASLFRVALPRISVRILHPVVF